MAATWTQGWPGLGGRPGRAVGGVLAALVTAGMVVALVRSGHLTNDGGSSKATATATSPSARAGGAAPVESVAGDSAAAGSKSLVAPDVAQGKPVNGGIVGPEPVPPSAGVGDGTAIVRSAEMAVRLKSTSAASAVARLGSAVEGMGGYVASTTSTDEEQGRGSADLVLRVPTDKFDAARKAVAGLGKVTSVSLSGDDVSGQLVDLDARLRTLRAEELALTELLGTSRDIPAILQVRDRLTTTRSEIEQLAGQQVRLRDQVRLASISVSLREAGATAPVTHDHKGFGNDLRTAGNALVAVVGGTLIVAAALAPIAFLALLALLAVRRYGRRHAAAG